MLLNENDFNSALQDDLDWLEDDLDWLQEDLEWFQNEGTYNTQSIVNIGGDTTNTFGISIFDAGSGENVRIAHQDEAGTETFSFERPQAALNIFDSQYYTEENPDVAASIADKYQDSSLSINL